MYLCTCKESPPRLSFFCFIPDMGCERGLTKTQSAPFRALTRAKWASECGPFAWSLGLSEKIDEADLAHGTAGTGRKDGWGKRACKCFSKHLIVRTIHRFKVLNRAVRTLFVSFLHLKTFPSTFSYQTSTRNWKKSSIFATIKKQNRLQKTPFAGCRPQGRQGSHRQPNFPTRAT